jgi:hypothetical protein
VSQDIFKLKSPCVDCPFRKDSNGVRHGRLRALEYALYFIGLMGHVFPCHRSVPEHLDRSGWTQWQDGQQMCAGGLAFAENVGQHSLTLQTCIDKGWHDPSTLTDREQVFASLPEMLAAHEKRKP